MSNDTPTTHSTKSAADGSDGKSSPTNSHRGRWFEPSLGVDLAIIFTAIAAIIPWNFVHATPYDMTYLRFQWWFGEYSTVQGAPELSGFNFVPDAISLQEGMSVYPSYLLYGLTSVIFGLAVILALLYLVDDDEAYINRFPAVTVSGGLLTVAGLGYTSSSLWMGATGLPGLHLPVGGTILAVMGIILLTN